ncbi:MAG: L-threonine 3-dehydrogenase [Alphaproteobacteria bacterium]
MKALGKLEKAPGLTLYEAPVPECGPNDVLIKVKKTAICGTDMHIYNWDKWSQNTIPVPMTTGHEFVGEIVALGSAVTAYKIGQRVSGEGHITCNVCRNCRTGKAHICEDTKGVGVHRDGAFAEYLSLPQSNVVVIPDGISDDIASILDPLGNAVHTTLSFDMVGEDVLITGAGPIGCMAVALAKHAGARRVVITDINPDRLELAKKMGADFVVDVSKEDLKEVMFSRCGLSEGFDVGLEMSGAPSAFTTMIDCLRPGSPIALLGIPSKNDFEINWGKFIFKGLILKGIYGREMYDTWYKMLAIIQGGLDVSDVITHRYKIDDFKDGFEMMNSGKSGKVILEWD